MEKIIIWLTPNLFFIFVQSSKTLSDNTAVIFPDEAGYRELSPTKMYGVGSTMGGESSANIMVKVKRKL